MNTRKPDRENRENTRTGFAPLLWKKALSLLAALAVGLSLLSPAALADDEIPISTAEDLLTLAKNCALDAWSRGRTFRLTDDISLDGTAFTPIPSFGGTFLGDGHLISGLRLDTDDAAAGLFRYVQEGAVVREVRVSGTVKGGGEGTGGLVGVNRGAVRECAFSGSVWGGTAAGGIAGRNEDSGEIAGCVVSGSVHGVSGTGGIAGMNSGQILSSQNQAAVNVTLQEAKNAMQGLLGRDVLEQLFSGTASLGTDLTVFDTGGIAGWSGGVIQSCTNLGEVGYPHVGYNTGGIAGRSSGYLDGCVNSGVVRGRKDVGGIAGQAEPDVTLTMGKDALADLNTELDTLNGLIQRAIDAGSSTRSTLVGQLSSLGTEADAARESARQLTNEVADLTDDAVRQVNTAVSDLTGAMGDMEAGLNSLEEAAGSLEALSVNLTQALGDLADAVNLSGDARSSLDAATSQLSEAANEFSGAAAELVQARDDLEQAVLLRDPDVARNSMRRMAEAITKMSEADSRVRSSFETIRNAFAGIDDLAAAMEALGGLQSARRQQMQALETLRDSLYAARTNLEVDGTSLEEAMEALTPAGQSLSGAAGSLADAMDSLNSAIRQTERPTDALSAALDELQSAAGSGVGQQMQEAMRSLSSAAGRLRTSEPIQFTPISSNAQAAGNRLYSALSALSADTWSLLRAADASGESLSASLTAVSSQLARVLDVASGTAEDIENGAYRDVIRDTSEADVAGMRMGKLSGSRNSGAVSGDRNVGGVAGALAIEYETDPESDLTEGFRFGSTFETRAVVQVCRNQGEITAKKSCVGGVVGAADLGAVLSCENYGDITSEDGGYVGGIAGRSRGVLRRSWSKCTLSGLDHVGGIAGEAATLTDCRAIVTVAACGQYGGAVAGAADLSNVAGNWFLNTGTAGIDGVSYSGAAEPISFEALQNDPATPVDFLTFALRLVADGKTVTEIPFAYGQDLLSIPLPPVPEKEGYSGTWPSFDTTGQMSDVTVEADYQPWITLLGSEEKRGDLCLALAEGQFTGAAVLHAEAVNASPPAGGGQPVAVTLENGGGEDGMTLRLLSPDKKGGSVYQLSDGRWVKRSSYANGQYLITHIAGTGGIFCATGSPSGTRTILIAVSCGGVVLLVAALALLRGSKRREDPETAEK